MAREEQDKMSVPAVRCQSAKKTAVANARAKARVRAKAATSHEAVPAVHCQSAKKTAVAKARAKARVSAQSASCHEAVTMIGVAMIGIETVTNADPRQTSHRFGQLLRKATRTKSSDIYWQVLTLKSAIRGGAL